jgi:hypothetical protein
MLALIIMFTVATVTLTTTTRTSITTMTLMSACITNRHYDFLCLWQKLDAASTDPKPHALSANAFLVGLPLESFIAPFIPANLQAKETLLGLVPVFNGDFKLPPSFFSKS